MKKSILLALAALLTACADMPVGQKAEMFPDYSDVTIPCNIAPLNFRISASDKVAVKISGASGVYEFKGRKGLVKFPLRRWQKMLEAEKGGTVKVDVVAKENVPARAFVKSFSWTICEDPIDRYLSYRLIEPAYEVWKDIQIEERDMQSFRTRLLGDNRIADECCMNCHTSNRAGTSFMHLRGAKGGTILNRNGKVQKLKTSTEFTGNTVYGDISADGRYGVFTTADIAFAIHGQRNMRMEVYDKESDLVVLDFDNLTVTDSPAAKGGDYQETFPCFSADGKTIFFCRAKHFEQPDSTMDMEYEIAVIAFNPETGRMGDTVITIVPAEGRNISYSLLKASPDGHWLMATAQQYGTFPVWHPESQLMLINLEKKGYNYMTRVNDWGADTYHSWSSNSRWIVFASKRDDQVYGRPYIAYIGPDGTLGKPFVLPQSDPDIYRTTLKSFNIPELYCAPEDYGTHDVASLYKNIEATQVEYRQ